jgi:hypothetical protein
LPSSNINSDQVKEDERGRVGRMHGRKEECVQGFDMNTFRKKTTRKT